MSPCPPDVPRLQESRLLALLVFAAGMASMASEILLSRFIQPFYGSSLIIWTLVIFSVLVALTIGYVLGGRAGDRHRRPEPLLRTLQVAALLLGTGPFLLRLLLLETILSPVALVQGLGIAATFLAFTLPILMVAITGPFVIRLLVTGPQTVGPSAGRVLGISTLGSLVGTFLPTYVTIPLLGTLRSFLLLATILGLVAIALHALLPAPDRRPLYPILVPLLGLWFVPAMAIRPEPRTIAQVESIYNDIKVREQTVRSKATDRSWWLRMLVLNEGFAVHSISVDPTYPTYPLVGSVWDYMCLMPLVAPPPDRSLDMAIVGLAGGTVAKGIAHLFAPFHDVRIEGAEIDARILELARSVFEMTEPNITGVARDGRSFLRTRPGRYDVILTDAYRQPYIPFHLTTREYFQLVQSRLKPTGFAMINVGASRPDDALLMRAQATLKSVFGHVYAMEVPRLSPLFANYLVLGTDRKLDVTGLMAAPTTRAMVERFRHLDLHTPLATIWQRLRPFDPPALDPPLTDDHAPVEHLVDMVILRTLLDPTFQIPQSIR